MKHSSTSPIFMRHDSRLLHNTGRRSRGVICVRILVVAAMATFLALALSTANHADDPPDDPTLGQNDLSGDQVDDLVNSNPTESEDEGEVTIESGTTSTLLARIRGKHAGDLFGFSACNVGDLNQDDFNDLLIGAPKEGPGFAYLFLGPFGSEADGPTTDQWHLDASDANYVLASPYDDDSSYGFAVAPLYDFDEDGYTDLRVLSWHPDANGIGDLARTYIYSGDLGQWEEGVPELICLIEGEESYETWLRMPMLGDMNNDGQLDDADVTLLTKRLGDAGTTETPLTFPDGDLNGDNVVDPVDLAALLVNLNYKAYSTLSAIHASLPPGTPPEIAAYCSTPRMMPNGMIQTPQCLWLIKPAPGTGDGSGDGSGSGGGGSGGASGGGSSPPSPPPGCLNITADHTVACVGTEVCVQALGSGAIPEGVLTWTIMSGNATFSNGQATSTDAAPCFTVDQPGDVIVRANIGPACTGTKRITGVEITLTPDPSTHADESMVTILPGDVEVVITTCNAPSDKVWFTIADGEIAMFQLPDGTYTTQTQCTTSAELLLHGRGDGETLLEAHLESPSGPVCDELPIHVGGSVVVIYNQAPTFLAGPGGVRWKRKRKRRRRRWWHRQRGRFGASTTIRLHHHRRIAVGQRASQRSPAYSCRSLRPSQRHPTRRMHLPDHCDRQAWQSQKGQGHPAVTASR